MNKLLFGFGNIDRQDDGVAWHILRYVAQKLNNHLPEFPDETTFQLTPEITCMFSLQLSPEDAEWVSRFDQVIFIDAHTGAIKDDLHFALISPQYESSPFTHHLTPQTCLALAGSLYGSSPEAYLVSVRGYKFGFSRELSAKTLELSVQAALLILEHISQQGDKSNQY